MRFALDGGAGGGTIHREQIAGYVPGRQPDRAQRPERDVAVVLAHPGAALPGLPCGGGHLRGSTAIAEPLRHQPADVEPGQPTCNKDFIAIDFHGKSCSHLDALAHIAWQGKLFNDNVSAEVVGAGGATFGTVAALGPIVTRGVLLDIPAVRGVDWIEPGEALHAEDLQAAEDLAGVRIEQGDAVLLRCGQFARRRALGAWDSGEASAGIHADAMPWIHERDIAVLGADGDSDVRPSPVPGVHSPVHILSLTAMGVPLLDNLDLEALSQACREEGSYAFQLTLAPLNIPMGTGCPLNPVAVL